VWWTGTGATSEQGPVKELVRLKKEHAATEERLKRMKKEGGWID